MQTTIVYILTSCEKDFYLEQLWLSLYSLRLHNPKAKVVLLTDDKTEISLVGNRAKIKEYLTEIKIVNVPSDYSSKERSRFIKTTFRKYLKGNLLFIDTDTIISEDLSSIDEVDADVGCVLDYHAPLERMIDGVAIRHRIFKLFGVDVSNESYYYNSGVMFVKDTNLSHRLFEEWHKNWQISAFEKRQCFDQPALMVADKFCGHVIKELSGVWNCQVLTSIQYLHRAKILHFFNNTWEGKAEWSPFFDKENYVQLKQNGEISKEMKKNIKDPKSAFYSPSYYTCSTKAKFFNTVTGTTLYSQYKNGGIIWSITKFICEIRFMLVKIIHNGKV